MTKSIHCRNCKIFDKSEHRCRDGKSNPRKKSDAVDLADLLGVQNLCVHNRYRDQLVRNRFSFDLLHPSEPRAIHKHFLGFLAATLPTTESSPSSEGNPSDT